jgi:hypothetical protein
MRTGISQRRLGSFDLFSGCTADEINTIDRLGTVVALPVGTPVWREEHTEPQFVMVFEGRIDLTCAGNHVATLTSGTWYGHDALLAGLREERISGVVVSNQAQVLAFSIREFASLLHAVPAVAATLQQLAAPTARSKKRRQDLDLNRPVPRASVRTARSPRPSRNGPRRDGDSRSSASPTHGHTQETTQ